MCESERVLRIQDAQLTGELHNIEADLLEEQACNIRLKKENVDLRKYQKELVFSDRHSKKLNAEIVAELDLLISHDEAIKANLHERTSSFT